MVVSFRRGLSLRRSALVDGVPLERYAVFDDGANAREVAEVGGGITLDQQQVSAFALGYDAEIGLLAVGKETRGVESRSSNRLRGSHAGFVEQDELAMQAGTRKDAGLRVAAGEDGHPGSAQAADVVAP